ncbi:hypothetical protein ABFS82_07G067200 [Erythranthe guttata]|uniref:Uncharacterized protein n=1 Tax=Erythranthe guttata TaxID=4155 RepID=A0A022QVZ0_ERYGU|nr:PREDICTED: stress response protein NST1-like [Erythranthe guttata]EYU31453.1 hypothetical protein MIMGU_mgv1a014258mg [Erythranthe guttata]|eukprot:XP_012844572.1 PREDICTED: stress response protein NST1-like [Erythranthe guttata]
MSPFRHLLRRSPAGSAVRRHFSTSSLSESSSSISSAHRNQHDFLSPSTYINSWQPSRCPKEAAAQLTFLRRDYARKMKEIRKDFITEMELQKIEKMRKNEARMEALRIANEEKRAAKDAKKKAEAIERQAAEQEFRQVLMKEREDKLEYWRMREKNIQKKKKDKNELLRKQSSLWVDVSELDKKINEVFLDTVQL